MSGTTRTSLHRHSHPFAKHTGMLKCLLAKLVKNKIKLNKKKVKTKIRSRAVSQQSLIVRLCFRLQNYVNIMSTGNT